MTTTNEAGKKGGKATKKKYGKAHFKAIGKKGADKRWNKSND